MGNCWKKRQSDLAHKLWEYLKFGGEQVPISEADEWALTRVRIAQRFPGWTFDYIDNVLTYDDLLQIFAVITADAKSKPTKTDSLT